MTNGSNAGRGFPRPALLVVVMGLLAVGAVILAGEVRGGPSRGPLAVANPAATEPVISSTGGVRWVANSEPPELLLPDSVDPTLPVRLLFFEGRPTHPELSGSVLTLDGSGDVLRVGSDLRVDRVPVEVDGRIIHSVAPGPDKNIWLVTGDGEILLLDETGDLVLTAPGPFEYSVVASDIHGVPWLVRSPIQFAFRPILGDTPLLARLDPEGEVQLTVGGGVVPKDFLLTHLASSGRIAIADSVIYYAPFVRDEVVALSMDGDTLWVASRGLPQAVDEPRFDVDHGKPVIDYAPVNLGIQVGPDDRLYVLSVPGFTTSKGRLDVLDRGTGTLLRTAVLPVPLVTLAADDEGRVYLLDEVRLLTGVPVRERPTFGAFDLETLDGARMDNAALAGKVSLVNFWASWCAPCREEMPALDRLQSSITDSDFVFLTMNEDVSVSNARDFLADYDFRFPVVLGRGKLKATYHYIGLPYTVVLDRDGKVVYQWIGFAGDEQIEAIRSVVLAELERGRDGAMDMDHGMDEHGASSSEHASHTHAM